MNLLNLIREEIVNLSEGIRVYHGSDRKFDKFDMSKIGSGDGKSKGGWGIYFSNSPSVSQQYVTSSGFMKEFEIPNGKYFDLDANFDDSSILNNLEDYGVSEDNIEEFRTDFVEASESYGDVTNQQAYDWLSYVLGGQKQASLFLLDLGYIGNTFTDKWEREARNYVLFDTKYIRYI